MKRVSPLFRVIALGLPVPEYPGYPIDPPLRSRFQGRYVSGSPVEYYINEISMRMMGNEGASTWKKNALLNALTFFRALAELQHSGSVDSSAGLLNSPKVISMPEFTPENVIKYSRLFPYEESISLIIKRLYPFHFFNLDHAQFSALQKMLDSFDATAKLVEGDNKDTVSSCVSSLKSMNYSFFSSRVTQGPNGAPLMEITFQSRASDLQSVVVSAPGGNHVHVNTAIDDKRDTRKLFGGQINALTNIMQSHCLGHDICLIGGYTPCRKYVTFLI